MSHTPNKYNLSVGFVPLIRNLHAITRSNKPFGVIISPTEKQPSLQELLLEEQHLTVGEVYSGQLFNKLTKGKRFVRMTNESEYHNGFQYRTGMNIDQKAQKRNDVN